MANNSHMHAFIVRLLVFIVFASNMYCAISFILFPESYIGSYQLSGEGAQAAIAGIGIVFCMWNVTYIPLIVFPQRFKILFGIVIAQQIIGLAGESWLYSTLNASQAILGSSIMRFIIFDSVGLVVLIVALILAWRQ